jgi:hypothetical protein
VIDPSAGYAYFGTAVNPGIIVKVALGSGNSAPTRVSALTLNSGENQVISGVIDVAGGFAYFATCTSPSVVVKVRLSNFTRVGSVTLNSGENCPISAVIDPAAGFAYFGTNGSPGIVVKVALGSGSSAPTRVAALTVERMMPHRP